jgi:hypothetical protein
MRVVAIVLSLALVACSQGRQGPEPARTESAAPAAVLPSARAVEPAPTADPGIPRVAGRYAPRDECAGLPGWQPFAASIRAAIAKRDSRALAALASKDILLDFGGGAGPAELIRKLDDQAGLKLWDDLDRVLGLGCGSGEGAKRASMPWFWEQDLGGADPFEVWLVTGDAVPLLPAADPKATPRARLGWVLVGPVGDSDWKARYRQVRVVGGKEQGYVEARFLRSQIDYRLISERIDGTWRITHLIAGD